MLIAKSMHPTWLSNSWLVADEPSGHGVIVDTGADPAPLWAFAQQHELTLTHVLNTHHHHDHVTHNAWWRERADVPALVHHLERELVADCDGTLEDGDVVASGGLWIECLHIPGHTLGQLAFHVNGLACFTGDTLFRRSIGSTQNRGHTTFADLRRSLLDVLLRLPPATTLHPGHGEPTTVADELQHNAFVRVMRGLDPEGSAPCTVGGRAAQLVVWGSDYDGGHKAWVRWADGGEDTVAGSKVVRPRADREGG